MVTSHFVSRGSGCCGPGGRVEEGGCLVLGDTRGLHSALRASILEEIADLLDRDVGMMALEAGVSRLSKLGIWEVEVAVVCADGLV